MSSSLIVLAGAGHANIQVLKKIAMLKPDVLNKGFKPSVILVSDSDGAAYSGMLPGFMMGKYSEEQLNFNLWKLTTQARCVFLKDKVTQIVPDQNKILFSSGRAPLEYDVLSFNIGITSEPIPRSEIKNNSHDKLVDNLIESSNQALLSNLSDRVFQLKPISRLLEGWNQFLPNIQNLPPQKIVVVGGGAAGIETAVALAKKIKSMGRQDKICIVQGLNYFLDGQSSKISDQIAKKLKAQNIELLLNHYVKSIGESIGKSIGQSIIESISKSINLSKNDLSPDANQYELKFFNKASISFDFLVLATGASAPSLFKSSSLDTDTNGYLNVNSKLQSTSHLNIFGAGDCINFEESPLQKSGVYAVREGRILAENILEFAKDKATKNLIKYIPQKRVLKLIHVSADEVLTQWGSLSFKSKFMVKIKTKIDLNFMKRFGEIPFLMKTANSNSHVDDTLNTCGGCGSKVPKTILSDVISELVHQFPNELPKSFEDCYELPQTHNSSYITVDSLKEFIQDPFLFGKISTLHSLSDLWVSGVKPYAITVSLGIKQNSKTIQKNQALQIMSGVLSVCQRFGLKLSNAHTYSSHEDQITVTALGEKSKFLFRKLGAKAGDLIILSKPLGTGIALQALMKADLDLKSIKELINSMTLENLIPNSLLDKVHAVTDVSGFGFVGHLTEVLEASKKSAQINKNSIPMFTNTEARILKGHRSFLMADNKSAFKSQIEGVPAIGLDEPAINGIDDMAHDTALEVIWDPQTNGPILATIPESEKEFIPKNWFVVGKIIEEQKNKIYFN